MAVALTEYAGPGPVSAFRGGDNTQKIHRVYFKAVLSGNYPGAPGDPMDFTTLGDTPHSEFVPVFVSMKSIRPAGSSGYQYEYLANATNPSLSNGFLQVLQGAAGLGPSSDLPAAAYPAGVTGDTIVGFADFIRL